MYRPSLNEAKKIAADYKLIPVSSEIYSDVRTPMEVLKILKNVSRHCFMLESLESAEKWGRYTFLGFDPKVELTCTNGALKVTSCTDSKESKEDKKNRESKGDKAEDDTTVNNVTTNHPREYIQQILDENKSPRFDYLPPFTGGLVGYFSYDYIKYNEPTLKLDAEDQEGFNDVDLMLFDKVIAFDHLKQKIIIIANVKTEELDLGYNKAILEIESMVELIKHGISQETQAAKITSDFRPLFNELEYCTMVNKAKHYIREGDIFQVVLSNRFEADFEGSLLDTYRVLRTSNPSPYMFYISSDDLEIAGASPETLVKLQNGSLYTFPLAGTKPRGKTGEEDLQNEMDLLSDPKELAEHNMLVDLGRNDLGRISQFGTVKVEKYLSIERFSHVMHIGSTVQGEIRDDKNALDAVDAVLPAGTLSGAPKIRACEIINELENNKRGIYGGAIGYLDFTGNLDTCIAIRIAFKKNGKVFVRSGAGIVADSVPENEYQECINKAQAVMNALKLSEEGID